MQRGKGKIKHSINRRSHIQAMIALWLFMFGSILLYFLFVKLSVWRPHIFWWWLTAILVVSTTIYAALLVIKSVWFGSHRTWSLAIFMLTVAPLVWFAAYTWSTIVVMNARGDMKLNLPLRALGIWVGAYFELEARFRYPRVTTGEHVQLFDNGETENVEQLVVDMDQHIKEMAKFLGKEPPKTKSRWVRGSIFGQSGRAIGAWALCNDDDVGELTRLDRHEVAHTLITTLCSVEQDMPMLLAEGWAQTQSTDKAEEILSLFDRQKLKLDEIVKESYGRSTGPAYSHGGPFVWYLLERFDGPTFLKLYGAVNRDTFESDVREVLGVEWSQLESDFWKWLESKKEWAMESTGVSQATQEVLSFDRKEDEALWQQILDTVKEYGKHHTYPEKFALEYSLESKSYSSLVRAIVEGDEAWTFTKLKSQGKSYELVLDGRHSVFQQGDDGKIYEADGIDSVTAENAIASIRNYWFDSHLLANSFMRNVIEPQENATFHYIVHRITPGSAEEPNWKISISQVTGPNPRKIELTIDPSHNFELVQMRSVDADNNQIKFEYHVEVLFGQRIMTKRTGTYEDGSESAANLRTLTQDEITQTKEEIEAASRIAVPTPSIQEPTQWQKNILSPAFVSIFWPAIASMFLIVDTACNRIRIKRRKS